MEAEKEEVEEVQRDEDQKAQETHAEHEKHDVKETPKSLKVKADPPDIPPEDRKRNVKKLAGAISHSLRVKGEINVRCFGNASIGKGAKALAISRKYVGVKSAQSSQILQLECSPAFISTKIGDSDLTGIAFCTFATSLSEDAQPVDVDQCQSVLMVKADPRDISMEDRKHNVKKLAGAIAHALEENREVVIRCFGNATIGKASKAIAIARGYTATTGADLYCWPYFIVADMNGNERTGIAFYAYTNET